LPARPSVSKKSTTASGQYDLGYIDLEEKTLQPLQNPFGPKVYAYVSGTDIENMVSAAGFEPATHALKGFSFWREEKEGTQVFYLGPEFKLSSSTLAE